MADPLIELLLKEEGTRQHVYDDATGLAIGPGSTLKGHPTIGVGRCLDKRGLLPGEIAMLLGNDVLNIRQQLGEHEWYRTLDPVRKIVVESMGFQIGVAGTLKFGRMIRAIQVQDWLAAANSMLQSKWYSQTPHRVRRLSDAMRLGRWEE